MGRRAAQNSQGQVVLLRLFQRAKTRFSLANHDLQLIDVIGPGKACSLEVFWSGFETVYRDIEVLVFEPVEKSFEVIFDVLERPAQFCGQGLDQVDFKADEFTLGV